MTSLPPADAARLAALSEHFRFGLFAEDIDDFVPAVAGALGASVAVEELYERGAASPPG